MEKKVNNKFTIFKLSLLITFLFTIIITTIIMGNRSEVNAVYVYDANNIRWDFNVNTTTHEITNLYTKSLTDAQAEDLVIPSTLVYNGVEFTVRTLGYGTSSSYYAFPKNIKKITIPDTVTAILPYCFYMNYGIENVEGGNGLLSIGNYAFYNCNNLKTITIPDGVTTIGTYAFNNCKELETARVPSTLTSLGAYAFSYCTKLTGDIVLPKNLTNLTGNPFNGTKITGLKFGDGISIDTIKTIYSNIGTLTKLEVYEDTELYKMVDGTLFSKDGKRLYLCAKVDYSNYVVPEGVTSIEANAFNYAKSMTGTLTLNEGLQQIGNYAFAGKSDIIGHLRIPDSVVSIGTNAFYNATSFDRVTIGSGVTRIEANTFTGLTDLFVNNTIGSITFANNYCTPTPVVHFLNSTKHVLISKEPGVKLVNVETGAEIETGDYIDETTFRYRVEVEEGYNYNHLELVMFEDNKYEEFQHEKIVLGQEYEFKSLLRDRNIYIRNLNEGVDLSLRTFITEVNRTSLSKSRVPVVNSEGTFEYQHTKEPVKVKKGDLVTYKIRVYNEALTIARATELTVHIPEGMSFDADNSTNKNYGWIQDGDVIKTSQLAFDDIHAYLGNGVVSYKDVNICLTVTEDTAESEVYKTVFAEITGESGEDTDSTPGNVTVSDNYRIEEIINSNSSSFIFDQEDDDDFDTVVLNSKIRVEYNLRIEKIDKDTDELLAGAKFKLISAGVNELVEAGEIKRYEDDDVIATVVSDENGIVDFGGITTYGEGENIFWIKEIDAPSGYLTNIGKKMKVKVVKSIIDEELGTYSVNVYCESSDYAVDTSNFEFTPVSNAEQLAKMGSGEIVNVDGVDYEYNINSNYRLTNDIDLSGINWTPIDKSLVGIIDGDGHKISNLTITLGEENTIPKVGLISEFTGIIENLTLENPNIHMTILAEGVEDSTDYYGVGGFVGFMKEGYFYNCKTTVTEGATSSITASIDNIGGFVGHTAPDGLVTIINCENNVDIIGADAVHEPGITEFDGTNNVGGLVGCALGSISVQNSKNTGDISCGQYGAGGLVGFVRPTDYEELSITAGYDEDNKRIDLLVENEAAKGQYNLTLEIRDRKTDRLIGGAIYEVDKIEDNIKTALLDTGTLKLFDKEIEYSGKDVYFMTEEETVPGYDLLNGIIRVDIDRYWDDDSNTYKVRAEAAIVTHKDYMDFIGERSTKEDEARTGKTFDKGEVFTEVNIARANWNGSKIEITNCTNEGKVSASYSNAGGMIGTAYGVVTMDNCTNGGDITGKRKTAGMVAEIKAVLDDGYGREDIRPNLPQGSLDYSVITNCVNNGKITSYTGDEWTRYASGGLVGEVMGFGKVINGVNNAEINVEQGQVGGIVGKTYGAITIEDSINNGKITVDGNGSYSAVIGGILGQAWIDEYGLSSIKYDQVHSVIKNCKNYAELCNNAGTNLGGIVGSAIGRSTTITDCEVVGENSENKLKLYAYSKGELGGILSWSSCKDVTITNCKVKYVDIEIPDERITEGTICNVAGIFAINDAGYIPVNNASSIAKRESTRISNCTVEDCTIINKAKEISGIMGITNGSYGYIDDNYIADIHDCNVKNTIIAVRCDNGYYPIAAGVYAGGYSIKGYNISYCNVEDSRIEIRGTTEESYSSQTSTVGGIFGRSQEQSAGKIEECNVLNTTLYNRAKKTTAGNTGGIFGTSYAVYDDLTIKNCNVKNSQIIEHNANAGGIIGGVMYTGNRNVTVAVEGCNVIETDITRVAEEEADSTNDCCVGGIAGSVQDIPTIVIKDTKVIGKDIARDADNSNERNVISSKYGDIAGAIGMLRNNTLTMSNVSVKNYDIINDVYINIDNYAKTQLGGIIASEWGSGVATNKEMYKNITVENVNIKGNKTENTAGFAASFYPNPGSRIENVNIKNSYIGSKFTEGDSDFYGQVGGLVGTNGKDDEFVSCKVEDCIISARHHGAAGGIVFVNQGVKAKDCTISNVEIRDDWEEPEEIEDVVNAIGHHRIFAGFIAISVANTQLEDIKVSNVDISAKYASIGGIYGRMSEIRKLENCEVEDCEFVSTKSISGIKGDCAGIGAETILMNCVPTNNKVLNTEITTDNHINSAMFGYIKGGADNPITINDSTVENVTLTHENKDLLYNIEHREDDETRLIEYNPTMAGIVAITERNIAINRATVKDSILTVKAGDRGQYTHVGGIVALSDSNITIDDSKVINTSITNNTSGSITGGFVGLNIGFETTTNDSRITRITNSSVEQNCTITANNQVGGMVGYANVQLENDKVLNATIKVINSGYIGGVIALSTNDANTMTRITVKDLTVPDGDALATHVGGIAGQFAGTLTNSKVEDSTLVANQCVAGAVAIYQNPTGGTSEIDNVTVTNVTATSKQSIAAGVASVAPGKVLNSKVYDSTIETKGTAMAGGIVGTSTNVISDVIVDGTDIISDVMSSSSNAGGVGACLYGAVTNATVKDSTVKGKWHAGGVAGTTMSTITNAEIDNVDITSGIQSAGGVVGITMGTVTTATVKDSTVKANMMAGGVAGFAGSAISDVEITNTSVTSVEDAGGVVGVASATVTDATVTGSTVVCKKLAGGIAGTMEYEIKNATVTGSTITSEELHAGGIVSCTKVKINNCTTKNSTIKTLRGSYGTESPNPTCLGGLVGAGAGSGPEIVNSTVENNTLTGATGTLVGKYIGAPTEINDELVAGE
jgi:hypothetical protein